MWDLLEKERNDSDLVDDLYLYFHEMEEFIFGLTNCQKKEKAGININKSRLIDKMCEQV